MRGSWSWVYGPLSHHGCKPSEIRKRLGSGRWRPQRVPKARPKPQQGWWRQQGPVGSLSTHDSLFIVCVSLCARPGPSPRMEAGACANGWRRLGSTCLLAVARPPT